MFVEGVFSLVRRMAKLTDDADYDAGETFENAPSPLLMLGIMATTMADDFGLGIDGSWLEISINQNVPMKPVDGRPDGICLRLLVGSTFGSLHQTLLLQMQVSTTLMNQGLPRMYRIFRRIRRLFTPLISAPKGGGSSYTPENTVLYPSATCSVDVESIAWRGLSQSGRFGHSRPGVEQHFSSVELYD
ncbi:unnamed protein product [Protopolystoma xenopodis]|uniref:Uncharacterized protein n=1 Tax=Protopolystoma xenopodis TaxID=117903 RepID=A0A3S5CHQ7_9PLAT|nr:unnamed protein product [Protopolystoma xenopodis]